ncbi:glycoside hydrolase family 19 protein [Azospirillum sp. RWY-5-1]|uniref:Glycoside hydrolase family 19 protein n=1 Tax=Azospirillum oleiclasticum TaxID=2735135 RepID=A0ABX2TDA4_9PROT|nr:glycoside hydrolase family 19 protein [Azospirillum oleiclasticum]NYZ21261.1 glycoside hydrolase family 19 protein [Azospirillum oleiclasticum]
MNRTLLTTLYPKAPSSHIDAIAANGDAVFSSFAITYGTNRLSYFLAQIGHESGGLTIFTENLNYSAQGLAATWPSRYAVKEGSGYKKDANGKYVPNDVANTLNRKPEAIANNCYADRMGNGNEASGDGWRFRGRGYIQITGRDAYRTLGGYCGLDLENNPDMASDPQHALTVACAFWKWKTINPSCDAGDFTKVTKLINGGTNGLADREAWLAKVEDALKSYPPAG